MSGRRRTFNSGSSLATEEAPQDTYAQVIQSPREAAVAEYEEQQAEARSAETATGAGGREAPAQMSMEEVQTVPKAGRKPVNLAMPKALELHRRMSLYKMDHEVQIQDQVTVAVDQWLRDQGY